MNDEKTPPSQRPDWQKGVGEAQDRGGRRPEIGEWEVVTAPGWKPKEMSLGPSAWVVRLVIAILVVIVVGEAFFLIRSGTGELSIGSPPVEQTTDSGLDIYAERPTPTIAPPPPTATELPPVENSEPVVIDKSF